MSAQKRQFLKKNASQCDPNLRHPIMQETSSHAWDHPACVQIPVSLPTSTVTLSKLFSFLVPQFPISLGCSWIKCYLKQNPSVENMGCYHYYHGNLNFLCTLLSGTTRLQSGQGTTLGTKNLGSASSHRHVLMPPGQSVQHCRGQQTTT